MAKWLSHGLGELELGVVMIDGIHIGEHVMLVALGGRRRRQEARARRPIIQRPPNSTSHGTSPNSTRGS